MRDVIKIQLMQKLMVDSGKYNWTYVHKDMSRIEEVFERNFPIAYKKVMAGETFITREDMRQSKNQKV